MPPTLPLVLVGQNGTTIWAMPLGVPVESPTGLGDRGFTTAVVWMTRPDDTEEGIAYGTDEDSQFHEVFCRRLQADPGWEEISALAYDTNCHQLAVSQRSQMVHRFLIDVSMRPHKIKSVKIEDHYPQAITFGHTGVKGIEIWSFGHDNGDIHVLNEEGLTLATHRTGMVAQMLNGSSGDAAINLKDDIFILDDAAQGIGLYKLSSCKGMKTFEVPIKSSVVVIMAVYTFLNVGWEQCVHTLYTGHNDWVQSVAAFDNEGKASIVVGRSGENIEGSNPIQVWVKKDPVSSAVPTAKSNRFEKLWITISSCLGCTFHG
ncbi:hypothetical protein BT96DRAFT_951784 [Gymnopus androsaceus JB14]|uniref:WD40 repeat-like protein n=1 Tax=Gymnopus androsaceus JB14 TaxID=1447944 RepID=A0A6A4GBL6_9AGAR|nr:hypothetical protein BT96DRAFT_951784 [Gymnopus androsaceus JB14]